MKRISKIPLLGFAITNSLYIYYTGTNLDIWIITLFLLGMGYLFSMVTDELNKENKTFLLPIIAFCSVFFTVFSAIQLKSAEFLIVAQISFISGFFARTLGSED